MAGRSDGILLALCLAWACRVLAEPAQEKHVMTEAAERAGAVCLDGTPPVYYLRRGFGAGVNKWYVHHQGGGWCESLDDCVGRSRTALGSSSSYPASVGLEAGYFSANASVNPMMYNWNIVFMMYCDGASFSGDNATVTVHNGTQLHFRGRRIREAFAQDLLHNQGLANASDLIVSGCSAGGLATYLHVDQWCDSLHEAQPSAKCAGLPDSGFFIDYQDPQVRCSPDSSAPSVPGALGTTINGDYHCGLWWTFHIQNASSGVNQRCLEQHVKEEWRCMFAEYAAEFLRTPVFALQSMYDSWQTTHVQGTGGVSKTAILGMNITERLKNKLLGKNPESGAFLDSCLHHCGAWNSIRIEGDLVATAVERWYSGLGRAGSKRLWNQNRSYPCRDCCQPDADPAPLLVV
ncbi:PAE5 [Symbiodinium natans]|uniref:PAE5 protein n=1 Tax=Symbiodinium natans TaxID=878477 RepID=A0A812GJL1_9DINO|nr:PAE5 [Symbiodinium natans]